MEELTEWLDANKISFKMIDNEVIEIEDFGKMFLADLSGVKSIFKVKDDEVSFNLMEDPSVLMEEDIYYVAFKFGDNWYYYDLREVFIFQSMHLLSYIIRRISRKNRASSLKNRISFVVMLIYIMYSNAAFFLTGSHYRFMNPVTIHPLASKLRQKSRMYIYDFIGISMQK